MNLNKDKHDGIYITADGLDVDLKEAALHPRMLELRFMEILKKISQNYGEGRLSSILEGLCIITACNFKTLTHVIGKWNEINSISKRRKFSKRYKQEMIFMGIIYGVSKYGMAKHWFNASPNILYRYGDELKPQHFITQEWLGQLDEEAVICGRQEYAYEVSRFLTGVDQINESLSIITK